MARKKKPTFETKGAFYDFDALLATLAEKVPPTFPVKVQLTNRFRDPEELGCCCLVMSGPGSPYFRIRIRKSIGEDFVCEVLFHEWAHALSWALGKQELPEHGPEWGVAYARVWRAIQKEKLIGY